MPILCFWRRRDGPSRGEILNGSYRGQKIISSQTKSVFILTLVKSFSRQSFRQNYFLSEFEWVDLRETAS